MEPRIEVIDKKLLVGMSKEMSLVLDKTFELFSTFMPRRKEVNNPTNQDILDLIIYPKDYFLSFNPTINFTKWAVVEVSKLEQIPKGMNSLVLPKGKYAVFSISGLSLDKEIFTYIYTTWLPNSNYQLDDRPHFDILSEKIQRKDPTANQEVWVPIKNK